MGKLEYELEYEFGLGCCTRKEAMKSKLPSARASVGARCSHQSDRTRGRGAPSLSARTMSQTHPNASSSSSSNFSSVLNAALDAYDKKTKSKLLAHPLAAQLQSCDSPTTILSVLQELIRQFDHRRRSDERLTNWLNPTVNVLYAFSSTVGQGVGLVSLN
jgi:hypothetical protein